MQIKLKRQWSIVIPEGLCPMLTVHDELCFNIKSEQEVDKIKDIMSNCVPDLRIPFEVDAELGDNWGEGWLVSRFSVKVVQF